MRSRYGLLQRALPGARSPAAGSRRPWPQPAAPTTIVRTVKAGSSPRPRRRNDRVPATTARIIRKMTSERFRSAHSDRLGRSRLSRAGAPSGRDAAPARRRSRPRRPASGRRRPRPIVASTLRTSMVRSETVRAGCRIEHPHRRLPVGAHQRAGRISMPASRRASCAGDGAAQPHRRRRVGQAHAHGKGAGHRIGARRDLTHAAGGSDVGIVDQRNDGCRGPGGAVLDLRRHVEHRVARPRAPPG